MNAPQRTPLAEPNVELIPVDVLCPSSTHVQQLRRKRFNPDRITEIADSLLVTGQLQAIVVRPMPPAMIDGRKFEIVLGERRWLAAQQAGLKHIEAKICELDDTQVLRAQLIENLQREDLHPLEEAEGYSELMAASGLKKEELGGSVGKSRSWVYARMSLLKLPAEARAALESGDIDVSRALEIAKIGDPAHQAEGLKLALQKIGDAPAFSVRELRERLGANGFTISLKLAPFNVAQADLVPDMGSCEGCEFRSGVHDPDAEDPDVCTNRSCFEKKSKAHGAIRLKEAEADGRQILRGPAAKEVSAGKDRYIGYIDVDQRCDFDEFSEPEPKIDHDEPENDPVWQAWDDRAQAWQPRTYRQLLGAGPWPFDTVLMEGKGKRVIELAPFKDLQKLLKKETKIELPAHIAQKPKPPAPTYDWKAEQEKREAAEKIRREKEAKERAWRIAVFHAIVKAKPAGKLAGEELIAVAEAVIDDHTIEHGLRLAGLKFPPLGKCTPEQIFRCLRLAIAAIDIANADGPAEELLALAKACKVDVAKIKREVEGGTAAQPKKKGKK